MHLLEILFMIWSSFFFGELTNPTTAKLLTELTLINVCHFNRQKWRWLKRRSYNLFCTLFFANNKITFSKADLLASEFSESLYFDNSIIRKQFNISTTLQNVLTERICKMFTENIFVYFLRISAFAIPPSCPDFNQLATCRTQDVNPGLRCQSPTHWLPTSHANRPLYNLHAVNKHMTSFNKKMLPIHAAIMFSTKHICQNKWVVYTCNF